MRLHEAARQYLGVKFQHQGRYEWALDCGGLLILAARDCGVDLWDIKGYARMPDGVTLKDCMDKQLKPADKNNLQVDDILLMKFHKQPQHIAIVTPVGMIHCWEQSGKVVEHVLDDKWRSRIRGAYKL